MKLKAGLLYTIFVYLFLQQQFFLICSMMFMILVLMNHSMYVHMNLNFNMMRDQKHATKR